MKSQVFDKIFEFSTETNPLYFQNSNILYQNWYYRTIPDYICLKLKILIIRRVFWNNLLNLLIEYFEKPFHLGIFIDYIRYYSCKIKSKIIYWKDLPSNYQDFKISTNVVGDRAIVPKIHFFLNIFPNWNCANYRFIESFSPLNVVKLE